MEFLKKKLTCWERFVSDRSATAYVQTEIVLSKELLNRVVGVRTGRGLVER